MKRLTIKDRIALLRVKIWWFFQFKQKIEIKKTHNMSADELSEYLGLPSDEEL